MSVLLSETNRFISFGNDIMVDPDGGDDEDGHAEIHYPLVWISMDGCSDCCRWHASSIAAIA